MAEKNKIAIGMVGGGLKSFMGSIHRAAIEKAGNVRLACGCFGASRQSSYDCTKPYGLTPLDVFGVYREFLRAQVKLPAEKRVSFITTVLPNTMHYPVGMLSMDCGIPVLCEKPFTTNLDEAANLVRKQKYLNVPYRIAMVYPAYSMLVKARKLIRDGKIGILRRFYVSMQAGWMAPRAENQGNRQAMWRTDAGRNGAGGVVTDAACHCQFALEWITGLEISEVCATGRSCVPGRLIPDDATAFVRTKTGISGTFQMSQIAVGHREGLSLEITGDQAALLWRQDEPGTLRIVYVDGTEKVITDATASGKATTDDAQTPFGANPAYVEALARVYREFAESIQGKRKKIRTADDRILGMSVEEALRSVAVTEAIRKSMDLQVPGGGYVRPGQPAPLPVPKWVPVVVPAV